MILIGRPTLLWLSVRGSMPSAWQNVQNTNRHWSIWIRAAERPAVRDYAAPLHEERIFLRRSRPDEYNHSC